MVLLFYSMEFFELLDGFRTLGEVERVKVFHFFKGVARIVDLATIENCHRDSRVLINVSGDTGDSSHNFYS